MARNALIQVRRDTAANWTSVNPTLASGEIGLETDTGRYKIGNGSTPWNSLQISLKADELRLGNDYLTPYTGFRNAIINGDFRINQRAWSSSSTSATYGYDRWRVFHTGGTVAMSSQQFTVGSPAATGYESPNFVRLVTGGQSSSGDYSVLQQPIEDARTFANSTVTISFWAKAASGTPKVAVELAQVFGTGGSPSADVNTLGGQVTLSTSWTRYSVTMTVPNVNGKTFGTTANTSSLNCNLWVSAGSTFNARLNSIGTQNATIDFWGVQVERGSVATPFEQRPIQTELAMCQRYYEKSYALATAPGTNTAAGLMLFFGTTAGSNTAQLVVRFLVPKRYTAYTVTGYNGFGNSGVWEYYRSGASNTSAGLTVDLQTEQSFRGYVETGAAYVAVQINAHWVCNAEF
jgi:hypothetical protein